MSRPTLILGDDPRIVVPVARSLDAGGVPVVAAAMGTTYPAVRSRAVRRYVRLNPEGKGDSGLILERLLDVARKEQVDWMIAAQDSAVAFFAEHHEVLRKEAAIGAPSPAAIRAVLNKERTLAVAAECDIEIPRTFRFHDVAELKSRGSELTFPLLAKPFNKGPGGMFKIRYYSRLEALIADYEADSAYGSRYMIQEYAPGVGVGIEVLLHRGEPQLLLQHRRIKEYPSTGGVSVLATTQALNPKLVDQSLRLLRGLEWDGAAMVEFRYDPQTERAILMEVNGRYWGSIQLAIASGADFPLAHWRCAHGSGSHDASGYKVGKRFRWTVGELTRVQELFAGGHQDGMPRPSPWKELLSLPLDFRPGIADALWSWRDPRPAVEELARWSLAAGKNAVKGALRIALPRAAVETLKLSRSLVKPVGGRYLRIKVLDAVRRPRADLPDHLRHVSFLCHGNIIRSAFAEALFRRHSSIDCSSAGVAAKPGRLADERAVLVAPEFGVSLADHRASPTSAESVNESDLIVVMDALNEAYLRSRFPSLESKIRRLGAFHPATPSAEIADPYHGEISDVRATYGVITACVRELSHRLESKDSTDAAQPKRESK